MSGIVNRGMVGLGLLAMLVLTGCGSNVPLNRAPVEDRGSAASATPVAAATAVKPPPGFENAGKPGYYTVKPGDTLIRIGLENGQSHKDLARWNALENPNRIEVGQVLRVVPPAPGDPAAVAVTKPVSSGSVVTTPVVSSGGAGASATGGNANTVPATSKAAVTSTAAAPVASSSTNGAAATANTPVAATSAAGAATTVAAASAVQVATAAPGTGASAAGEDELPWIWPGKGAVLAEFNESKNKGVDIAGNAGDPVLAAADGKVVYAGAGLRGYGNLIILKHNNTYLSAYAHNQTLLVKEDQTVRKGQKIAEMGSSDTDRVKLHFEIRRQGKPVDPQKYLPNK